MRLRLILAIMAVSVLLEGTAAERNIPKADPTAEIVCGNARFTVLTSRLIRMEWAEDGKFEDRASFTVVNRCLPVPAYEVEKSGEVLMIKTEDVSLFYIGGADLLKTICRYRLN